MPDRRRSRGFMDADEDEEAGAEDMLPSKQSLQEIAHERGRICKKRGCVVCAPLVERRRLKKKQRKAEAQAQLHAKGQPCGRGSCSLAVCVEARDLAAASAESSEASSRTSSGGSSTGPLTEDDDDDHDRRTEQAQGDRDRTLRRQAERHRVGLPCGSEECPRQVCIDGFANERTRRHRARRPCRSATCDNVICVAARSTN